MTATSKLTGRALYESLGSPKRIVAPMVDQSELAWRILSRKYGADLCYTPMYNAKQFGTSEKYRKAHFAEKDGDPQTDRPLIVQFCANKPEELLEAAKHVVGRCDAVDLNLGCPQGIARKGHYGAFLMEDWDLIASLIRKLNQELEIPVTAKIRIYKDKEKTLEYAKMVLAAGAQFLTVHTRTREMKGQQTGLADWTMLKFLRDSLPADTVIFSNGNILYPNDIERCIAETGADAVMSAETNLVNPAVFVDPKLPLTQQHPRVDVLLREYFEIVKQTPGRATISALKTHFFKLLRSFLTHHIDIRNEIGQAHKDDLQSYENIVVKVEQRVAQVLEQMGEENADFVIEGDNEYKTVPYWRAQPLFRVVNGIASNGRPPAESEERAEKRIRHERTENKVEESVPLEPGHKGVETNSE